MPNAGGRQQPGPATPPGSEERARTLSLIDFLADYDARRNPGLPGYQGYLEQMRALYRDPSVAVPDTLRAMVSDAPPALAGEADAGRAARADAEPLLLPLPADEEQQGILTRARHSTGVTVHGPPGTGTSHAIANIVSHHVAHGKRVLVVAEKEQALRALTGMIPAGIKDLTVSVPGADAEHLPGQWAAGDTPTRADAARWVAAHRSRLGYVADRLAPSVPRPLTAGEAGGLIRLIRLVGADRADACACELPDLTAIPFAAELEDRFAELARLEASVRALGDAVHDWGLAVGCGRDGLRALAARCHADMEWIAKNAGTWLGHVREQVTDPLLAQDWQAFHAQLSNDRAEALRLRGILTAHQVVIPDVVEPALIDGLEQAKERLSELGKLGMFAGPAKRALSECEVDGRPLRTVADIDLCLQQATLESLRERIRTAWRNQVTRVGGAVNGTGEVGGAAVPEDLLGPPLEDLARVLAWPHTWAQVRADLAAAGVGSPAAADADVLTRLADVCVQACDQIGVQELARRLRGLDEWLRTGGRPAAASPLWNLFADALSRQDLAQWHQLREQLRDLQEIAPQARWLRELLGRLSAAAPAWAARILADPAAAGDPADFDSAWQWRQLDCWVRDGLAGPTPAELQDRVEELSAHRRRVIAELVGGGKDAIPVWIMPAARALAWFRPEADPPFDVLVVGEASRMGLEAVPLLALARKVIVVGDDRQAGPAGGGLDRQQVFDLLDEHLAMIPAYRTLFDPGNSLYDIAVQRFPGVVMLTGQVSVAAGSPGGGREQPALFPYQPWTPRPLARPDTAPPDVVMAGLREIVAAEGPVHAQRAYRLYTLAAGGRRVGPEMRRALHAATLQALRAGDLRQLDDEVVLLDNKTLYAPGGPTILVRELGPRRLSDVPRSEVAKLVRYLGLAGATDDEVKRAVLEVYGLVRLTARTSQYLDECLRYRLRRRGSAAG